MNVAPVNNASVLKSFMTLKSDMDRADQELSEPKLYPSNEAGANLYSLAQRLDDARVSAANVIDPSSELSKALGADALNIAKFAGSAGTIATLNDGGDDEVFSLQGTATMLDAPIQHVSQAIDLLLAGSSNGK